MYSLDQLDMTKLCEQGYEFEVIDEATGKPTGMFLTVIGGHAQRVQDFVAMSLNQRRTAEALQKKRDPRDKELHVTPIEDDMEFSTELVAIRIIGWRGIAEEYSHANAIKLCTINPPIKEQILAKSENLKNFPMPAPTS